MTVVERHLHVVPRSPHERDAPPAAIGDVGVTLMLFVVSALPLMGEAARFGRWSGTSLGLGTLGVLLAGRELWARLVANWRSGRLS